MAKLVFDIETVAMPATKFDPVQQEYLFREAENLSAPAERDERRQEIERQFSLWPFTGRVVCIAMVNIESSRGKVLYENKFHLAPYSEPGGIEYVPCKQEADLLHEFWEVALHYDSIITFNGRAFDVPFLYLRSAMLKIAITRKNWLGYRYSTDPHCDLLEQLTFYGISGRDGAARRFNLDFYCKAFGIQSPKAFGVTGMDVSRMIEEGHAREVAEYCLRDARATAELYKVWKERLASLT